MSEENKKLPPHTEFETKYSINVDKLMLFKKVVEDLPNLKKFLYVQGPDRYYVHPDPNYPLRFARFRKAQYDDKTGGVLTFKERTSEKNNYIRGEDNLILHKDMTLSAIETNIKRLGFNFEFSIWKSCHIYKYSDVTLVFYTVQEISEEGDRKEAEHHFVEIELDEDSIHTLTEDEAWEIIRKYEQVLAPTGIVAQGRMKKSLFDMFTKSEKE